MKYERWKPFYERIIKDLLLDEAKDETAAQIFDQLINTYSKQYSTTTILQNLIEKKNVCVFGAAPSLEQDIKDNADFFLDMIKIAADGATTALLKYDINPDIIVTDLDGVIADQLRANKNQAILLIHAHGDNIATIQRTIPKIKGPYFGTIQTNPALLQNVKNFGGFTDGDRAVFIADHFKANHIYLAGFDCSAEPGFYSFQTAGQQKRKRKKLEWCQQLLTCFPKDYLSFL